MKILIVEDERSMGVLLGITLRRLGHVPLLAINPRDALDLLDHDIDAVITDIDMPGMTGVQLARTIRELHADLPIAFCTGSDPASVTVREAATIGPVLHKVCTMPQIRELVEHLGRNRRRRLAGGSRPPAPKRPIGAEREARRYRVHLQVAGDASLRAAGTVENLSVGGLFLRGAHHLQLCDRTELVLTVPGTPASFRVAAEVAYILTPQGASAYGRHPGAGFAFTSSPAGFAEALDAYLDQLDRRCDSVILSTDDQCRELARDAGYRAETAPAPAELPALLAARAVAAVIVPRAEADAYRRFAGELVHAFDFFEEVEALLHEIDTKL